MVYQGRPKLIRSLVKFFSWNQTFKLSAENALVLEIQFRQEYFRSDVSGVILRISKLVNPNITIMFSTLLEKLITYIDETICAELAALQLVLVVVLAFEFWQTSLPDKVRP